MLNTFIGQGNHFTLFIKHVIVRNKLGGNASELLVAFRVFARWCANNKRGSRFVNQNRVNLVDDSVMKVALTKQVDLVHHVVA